MEVNDPDRGKWTFSYDGVGELLSQTDANGNTTTFLYDRLGRMYGRKVNGTVDGYWLYDGQKKGLVDSEQDRPTSPTFLRQYTYDDLSRPTKTTTTVDGIAFAVEQAYDSYYGRVKGVGYPSGEVIELNYDDFGYLAGERDPADEQGSVFRQVQAMTARGQVERELFGNGLTGFYAYHGSTGQMASVCVSTGTTCTSPIQRIDYGYEDAYENLTLQTDVVQGVSERYTYDNLQRLGSATRSWSSGVPAPVRVNYGYDALGNITLKSDYAINYVCGTMTRTFPDYAGPHAVQWAQKTTGAWTAFRYDGNGNMVWGDGRSVGYDAHNKPTSITSPTGETTIFYYGPDGERYKQVSANKTTYYVGEIHELIVTSGQTEQKDYVGDYLVITNRKSGVYGTRSLSYLHKDRLGSVDTVTDDDGTVLERHGFDAFGKPRGDKWQDNGGVLSGGATTRGFTEHEHLDTQQLIHMNGRAYDYNLGRFLSVDPIIQSPANSQSLNPYSYILNNPLSGVDPTGYSCEDQTPGGNCANPNRVDLPGRAPTGSHIIRKPTVEAIYDPVTNTFYVSVTNGYTGQTTISQTQGPIADTLSPASTGQSTSAGGLPRGEGSTLVASAENAQGPMRRQVPSDRPAFLAPYEEADLRQWAGIPYRADVTVGEAIFMSQPDTKQALLELFRWSTGAPAGVAIGMMPPPIGPGAGKTITELLRPGGRLLGEAGSSASIRLLKGGRLEAEALFKQLSQGGRVLENARYPGTLVELPGGGTAGLRMISKSGPPTIDVVVEGLGIREIKFLP